jgi:predicted dehydrogenase
MITKEEDRLRVGVLGAGPIAQFAHFESCAKARNVDLYAICDVAGDLLTRMSAMWLPEKSYRDYEQMLADPNVDAVIIATSDAFHVPASLRALAAGKHVLCEKPIGVGTEEIRALKQAVTSSGKVFQVGHMKRFDPGIQAAKAFIVDEIGEVQALKAWYCDSMHRYSMTDAVQPIPIRSAKSLKPEVDPKADREKYLLLAHGSHLVDLARHLGGEIVEVRARLSTKFGSHCWFVDVGFGNGCLGHLDLTVAVRMDWHEGFHIYGERGAVIAKSMNPWYRHSSDVDIFREWTASYTRVLGADGHSYRRQLEGFADVILRGAPMVGADVDDGIASIQALIAIRQSVREGRSVSLSEATGIV